MHLLRDPLGIKPLYYWILANGKGVIFASEVRSFLALDEFKAQVSARSLNQYIEFGYSIDATATIFEGVKKPQPGHRFEIRGNSLSEQIPFYLPDLTSYSDANSTDIEDHLY
jgi:asparagine synthase (glutamine-hydrolysing)